MDGQAAWVCMSIEERSIVMSVSVCVRLSVRDHILETTRPILTKFFMRVTNGRGSVFLWRRSDALCRSGFMDDVIFTHFPSRRPAEAQCTRSLGLGYKLCAVIPDADDCLVSIVFGGRITKGLHDRELVKQTGHQQSLLVVGWLVRPV